MCLKGAPWLLVLAVTAARARTWSCIWPGSTMSLKSFFTASLVLPPLARRCHSQRREVSRTRLGVPSHLQGTSAGPLLQLTELFKPICCLVTNVACAHHCIALRCITVHCLALHTGVEPCYSTHTPRQLTKPCALVHVRTSARCTIQTRMFCGNDSQAINLFLQWDNCMCKGQITCQHKELPAHFIALEATSAASTHC